MSSNDSQESKYTFGERGAFVPFLIAVPLVLLAISGLWALRGRPQMMASLERGEADGRAFATSAKKTPSECLDGATAVMENYVEPREPGAAAFLESCLKTSGLPITTGHKHSAPTRGQLEAWTRDECAARGHAGDKHCSLLLQLANLDPCAHPFVGQTRAVASWTCP